MSEAENLDVALDCRDWKPECRALIVGKSQLNIAQYAEWTQRDGTPIRIIDMGDGHLINTIKMIHRRAQMFADEANRSQNSNDPDMPYYEYEAKSFRPNAYDSLVFEAKKRGLVVPVQ